MTKGTKVLSDWHGQFAHIEGADPTTTMRSYQPDAEAFENWCLARGISDPFPTLLERVFEFLKDQTEDKAPSNALRRLYAIRKAHRLLKLPYPTYGSVWRSGGSNEFTDRVPRRGVAYLGYRRFRHRFEPVMRQAQLTA
ncbi:hypothetical protein CHX26_09145 [Porphyrobacter sp. HT-58-2]|uniref:hypothetical protein n=1 Tax=Porphyrobacter sp. HT-58-2 TaxID=2023229 RepID=UPI000CDCB6E9|nr:hypothetical protein [Porphyrobacter sp. HT-58-2]AUX69637.1 hypothetical protein CHX26_09145 [Porphyrobacter sp. HT-58-2]